MNKIQIEDIKNKKDLYLEEDSIIYIDNKTGEISFYTKKDLKVFIVIHSSDLRININTENNLILNIISYNSKIKEKIDLLKNDITLSYAYSTINKDNNSYEIDINHLASNIKSNIVNHGINIENNTLSFIINTVVPKNSLNIDSSQDSKIISFEDGENTIKPNLLIDNDDIVANHSAYIGKFKDEELFYLMSRGLTKEEGENLLVKSFLLGNMNINEKEKDITLEFIKKYWR